MKEVLGYLVRDQSLEARWLATLSLLEFIGARKIGKTVAQQYPSIKVLEHHADETRHAAAFKRLSLQLSEGQEVEPLCREEAIGYFQKLDRQLSDWITKLTGKDDAFQNYLLVTSIIERRAMKLYPLYRKLTRQEVVQKELEKVIEEENSHRIQIARKCLEILRRYGKDLSSCEGLEEDLFQNFTLQIKSTISERIVFNS